MSQNEYNHNNMLQDWGNGKKLKNNQIEMMETVCNESMSEVEMHIIYLESNSAYDGLRL